MEINTEVITNLLEKIDISKNSVMKSQSVLNVIEFDPRTVCFMQKALRINHSRISAYLLDDQNDNLTLEEANKVFQKLFQNYSETPDGRTDGRIDG